MNEIQKKNISIIDREFIAHKFRNSNVEWSDICFYCLGRGGDFSDRDDILICSSCGGSGLITRPWQRESPIDDSDPCVYFHRESQRYCLRSVNHTVHTLNHHFLGLDREPEIPDAPSPKGNTPESPSLGQRLAEATARLNELQRQVDDARKLEALNHAKNKKIVEDFLRRRMIE